MFQGFLRWLGVPTETEPTVSREDIEHLIDVGTAEGVFKPVEQKLAVGALNLGDRTVRQIMRPRLDIDAADVNTPAEEVLGVVVMAGFSRLPVYEGDLDHILGIVHLKDVLRQHYLGWPLDLRKLARPALFVPDTMRLDRLLVLFQERHNAAAIVVDEFGQTKGMVTLEDIVHDFVGEIQSEQPSGEHDADIVQRDETSWLVSGTVTINDLLSHLHREHLADSAPKNVSTVAGLLLTELGHIPKVGAKTTWNDLQLEVVDIDGQRVDKVLVSVVTEDEQRDKSE